LQLTTIAAIFFAISTDMFHADWFYRLSGKGVFLFFAGVMLVQWSLYRGLTRGILARLTRFGWQDKTTSLLPSRIDFLTRLLVLTIYAVFTLYGGWGDWVINRLKLQDVDYVLLGELAILGPFLVFEGLRLWCYYPINRTIREQLMMGQLAEGMAARPVWSLGQYLSFQFRYGILIVVIPILLIMLLRDVIALLQARVLVPHVPIISAVWLGYLGDGVLFLGAAGLFISSPLILRHVWLTRTLPAGILRQKLEDFCRRLGLKYRDLLLWDTYGAVGNAAVMGLVARCRYVLMSDALIENLPDKEILAVFGHEAGHIRCRHIFFLVMFVVSFSLWTGLLIDGLYWGIAHFASGRIFLDNYENLFFGFVALILGLSWILLFGWISHQFEHQSDLLGALAVDLNLSSVSTGDEAVETPTVMSRFRRGLLTSVGSAAMANALGRIAMINGICLSQRSWRHPSLMKRINFLQNLIHNEILMKRFYGRILTIKLSIAAALATALGGWVLLMLREGIRIS